MTYSGSITPDQIAAVKRDMAHYREKAAIARGQLLRATSDTQRETLRDAIAFYNRRMLACKKWLKG